MQKGLNVLISHTSVFERSGWGRVFPLATGIAKHGHRVTILTTNPTFSILPKRKIINNVNVIVCPEIVPSRISKLGFGLLSLFFKLLHTVFNNYDIVHSDNGHRPLSGLPCRVNKRIYKSVYVAEWYDWYGKGGQYDSKHKLFKFLLGWYELKYEIKDKKIADGVVPLSQVLKERALKFKMEDRIKIIHGGSDIESIPFVEQNSDLKEKYGIEKDRITFGYINSASYILEEFEPLINAVLKYGLESKVKILLFGDSQSIEKKLSNKVKTFVKTFGWIDFKNDYEKLQCVDIFFLLKQEILGNRAGWPNSIGDCLACGRHILINPVGEVVNFAKKYPLVFLITNKEVDNIYDKIVFYIENEKQLINERNKIRAIAEKEVSWDSKSNSLVDFYNKLIDKKK